MTHEELLEEARQAINKLFDDTSVSQEQTAEDLHTLLMEIQELISTLDV